MAIKDAFKIGWRTFFNPRRWLGYDYVKSTTRLLINEISALFIAEKPTGSETFDQAMQRLNLNENNLVQTANFYRVCMWGFLFLALIILVVSFYYLFKHHSPLGFLLGIVVSGIPLAQAFRFSFWLFQIKHRKLGCTLQEWRAGKIKTGNP